MGKIDLSAKAENGCSSETIEIIEKMRKDGYPYKIKVNGRHMAVLYDMQPLFGDDHMAIYRYPGWVWGHDLLDIQMYSEAIEQWINMVKLGGIQYVHVNVFIKARHSLGTEAIRFFLGWIAESIKADCFSDYRRMMWRNVWIHFGVTILFFYLVFHI